MSVMPCHAYHVKTSISTFRSQPQELGLVFSSDETTMLTLNGLICVLKKDYRTGALLCLHIKVANGLKM